MVQGLFRVFNLALVVGSKVLIESEQFMGSDHP